MPTGVQAGAALVGIALALANPTIAQDAAPGLGPHDVGFRLLPARDSTRSFLPKRSASGEQATGDLARPVLVALWYPAAPAPDAAPMTTAEFRTIEDVEWDFTVGRPPVDAATGVAADADTRGPPPVRVIRDASPLAGPHPVVLMVGRPWVADQWTPAVLASHGYLVAAVGLKGRMTHTTLEFTPNPLALDSGIDDLGFVYALLQREPMADTRRLALYAFSATTPAGLLWQMRDMQADALVLVEGWERIERGAEVLGGSVHYDPLRVRVPLLLVEGKPFAPLVGDVVDSLAYAEVTRVSFPTAEHGDFLSDVSIPGSDNRGRIHAEMLSIVVTFLDASLREGPSPSPSPDRPEDSDGLFRTERTDGAPPLPTEEELFRLAEVDADSLVTLLEGLRRRARGRQPIREHVLSRAATAARDPADRLLLARLTADMFPASTNARWQLAGLLSAAGAMEEAAEALEAARRNLQTDPAIEPAEREAWKNRIEQALEEERARGAGRGGAL